MHHSRVTLGREVKVDTREGAQPEVTGASPPAPAVVAVRCVSAGEMTACRGRDAHRVGERSVSSRRVERYAAIAVADGTAAKVERRSSAHAKLGSVLLWRFDGVCAFGSEVRVAVGQTAVNSGRAEQVVH